MELVFPFAEAEGNGRRGGVAVFVDVDHHFGRVEFHTACRCIDDAEVCLMRNEICDVAGFETVALHYLN